MAVLDSYHKGIAIVAEVLQWRHDQHSTNLIPLRDGWCIRGVEGWMMKGYRQK